jgi:osmotically inducible protein OsmC
LSARRIATVPELEEDDAMPTRTSRTTWRGGLQDGAGSLEFSSSGLPSQEVSFPRRAAAEAGGVTSPEELIAAAHSSCFAMQMSALLGEAGSTGTSLDVTAEVSLGPDDADGGFRITGIQLTVRGSAAGVDDAGFTKAAQQAKEMCPVSKALSGAPISLDVAAS